MVSRKAGVEATEKVCPGPWGALLNSKMDRILGTVVSCADLAPAIVPWSLLHMVLLPVGLKVSLIEINRASCILIYPG